MKKILILIIIKNINNKKTISNNSWILILYDIRILLDIPRYVCTNIYLTHVTFHYPTFK